MSIVGFLTWLATGLGASFVASALAERSKWFQFLTYENKKLYVTIGASVLAVLAYITVTYVPMNVWAVLTPYWQLVVGVIAVNYGTLFFHKFDKEIAQG